MLFYTITISAFPNGEQSHAITCSGSIDASGIMPNEVYKRVHDIAVSKMMEENPDTAYGAYAVDHFHVRDAELAEV